MIEHLKNKMGKIFEHTNDNHKNMTSIKLEYVSKNMWNGKSYTICLCLYISARTGMILKGKL